MTTRERLETAAALGLLLGVFAVSSFWFCFGSDLRVESAPRIAAGAFALFLMPGLVLGELLRLRGRFPLETVALAFLLSLVVEIGLLLAILPFGVGIGTWVALLLVATALGMGLVLLRLARGGRARFLRGLLTLPGGSPFEKAVHAACALLPLGLAVAAYRWGEVVGDLSGEKLVHMTFVRYYREMPLTLSELGIGRGLTPPNLIHLWEFLVAAWSRCVRVDPLPLFCRCRVVVPVLGFAGMYLLTRLVCVGRTRTLIAFVGVLLLCLARLVLDAPCLAWVRGTDPTRGVFAFSGSAHHGDTAMDVLLPLSAAVLLLWLRRPGRVNALLVVGALAANFLWHPREFLQLSLYLGVLVAAAALLPSLRRRAVWKRLAGLCALLVAVAVTAALTSAALVGRQSQSYDEMALKRTALRYAAEREHLTTVRNLFNQPLHFSLSSTMAPEVIFPSERTAAMFRQEWHYDLWLFLAAGAALVLGFLGDMRDRRLAFYQLMLWLLAHCWNAAMLVILALTYSEFFHSMPRLLYLFAYLVIARGAAVLGASAYAFFRQNYAELRLPRPLPGGLAALLALAAALGVGYGLRSWVRHGQPGQAGAAVALSGASFLLLAHVFGDRLRWLRVAGPAPRPLLAVALVLAVLLPVTSKQIRELARLARRHRPSAIAWFAPGNPFGYSPEFIDWLRALSPGHQLLCNPLHMDVPCIYSAQYLAIHPAGSIIKDNVARQDVAHGRHPFYRPPASADDRVRTPVDHAEALRWLSERGVQYVIVSRRDYAAGLPDYFRAHPDEYEPVFDSPGGREAAFRVRATTP